MAPAFRRPGFYFWLCHWPAEWFNTNDFNTSAKLHIASARLTLSHSPQAVPAQHLHPTHLQRSHGLSSASWSLTQAVVYQPPPDVPACCAWATVSQSRREGSRINDTFASSTYLSSLSMSQGLMSLGRLSSQDTTHGLHQLCTLACISQQREKSRSSLPFVGLYFSFYHLHFHEKSLGTRLTFPMVCMAQRGSSSPEEPKSFCAFMTTDSFFCLADPSSTKLSL